MHGVRLVAEPLLLLLVGLAVGERAHAALGDDLPGRDRVRRRARRRLPAAHRRRPPRRPRLRVRHARAHDRRPPAQLRHARRALRVRRLPHLRTGGSLLLVPPASRRGHPHRDSRSWSAALAGANRRADHDRPVRPVAGPPPVRRDRGLRAGRRGHRRPDDPDPAARCDRDAVGANIGVDLPDRQRAYRGMAHRLRDPRGAAARQGRRRGRNGSRTRSDRRSLRERVPRTRHHCSRLRVLRCARGRWDCRPGAHRLRLHPARSARLRERSCKSTAKDGSRSRS